MRPARIVLASLAAAALMAGCGGAGTSPTRDVDLTDLVNILPTPPGLDRTSSIVRSADAAGVQAILARVARPESAREFEKRGFGGGAIRTWTGANGARFEVVVSRWPDNQVATTVGAGAAELPLGGDGASAWNPRELPGARGARVEPPGVPSRSLSVAVADLSLFVRADGSVGDGAVVRTLDLLARRLRAPERA